MAIKKLKVVVDTNLWISFLISCKFEKIDSLFESKDLALIFSEELLEEFIEVAKRPKFRKYFSITDLINLLNQIHSIAEFVEVKSSINICRDRPLHFS